MLTDYELFLGGCYDAVVEINYDNDDLYNFMDLMDDLGFKKYVDWLRQVDEKHSILDNARYNGIKHLCFEFQFGKGFTYGEKQEYLDSCEETKVLSLNDLIKSVGKEKDFCLDYEEIDLTAINGDKTLEELNTFCEMYDWRPVKCSKGFNIRDIEFENTFVEQECYKTFEELVNRIVGRAVDYYNNEMYWDEDDTAYQKEYGEKLYDIALRYKKQDKWEQHWLDSFRKDLDKLGK